MTTSSIGRECRLVPLNQGNFLGTGMRLDCSDEVAVDGDQRLLEADYRRSSAGTGQLAGALALGGAGIATAIGGGPLGARVGSAGIGRGVGLAVGVAALAGAGLLAWNASQNRSEEHLVHFRQQPDLSGVAPGDVYATLRAHHERNAPAVERVLDQLVGEGKVRGYSGIIGSNGFVVDVVRRHRDEVQQRLEAVQEVGDVSAAPMLTGTEA